VPAGLTFLRTATACAALSLIAACASTPQASAERDAEAKAFVSHPATAAIYIYRYPWSGDADDTVLYVNGRLIGSTVPGGYFLVHVPPGVQRLEGAGYDAGRLEFEARAGEIHFVALHVISGTSHFARKEADTGRRELVNCCVLFENWAPGQRPLLR
jgi:hypothetical protein